MEIKLTKLSFCIAILLFLNCIGNARASSGVISQKAKPARTSDFILPPEAQLSLDYYLESCPQLEGIIQQKLHALVKKDNTLAASIIRLHFHDCFARVISISSPASILTFCLVLADMIYVASRF